MNPNTDTFETELNTASYAGYGLLAAAPAKGDTDIDTIPITQFITLIDQHTITDTEMKTTWTTLYFPAATSFSEISSTTSSWDLGMVDSVVYGQTLQGDYGQDNENDFGGANVFLIVKRDRCVGEVLYNTHFDRDKILWQATYADGTEDPYVALTNYLSNNNLNDDDIITIGCGPSDISTDAVLWGSVNLTIAKCREIKAYCDGIPGIGDAQYIIDPSSPSSENLKVYHENGDDYVVVYIFNGLSMGFESKSNFEANGITLWQADSDSDSPSLSWHLLAGDKTGHIYIAADKTSYDEGNYHQITKYILGRELL